MAELNIPNPIRLDNGSTIDRCLAFCMLLDKLASPTTNKRLEHFYQVDETVISRIINFLLFYMHEKFRYTLIFRKCLVDKHGERYADAIAEAGVPRFVFQSMLLRKGIGFHDH